MVLTTLIAFQIFRSTPKSSPAGGGTFAPLSGAHPFSRVTDDSGSLFGNRADYGVGAGFPLPTAIKKVRVKKITIKKNR